MNRPGKGIAKTTRPSLTGVIPRKRLFERLDDGRDKRVIWVSAPAGYGKTTLVTDYLDQTGLACLWYQLDSGEGDVATFFYYMGQSVAALGDESPLPTLAPEYRGDLSTFSHRYFRELFSKLTPPFAVVFDNYQDVPVHSKFHDVIRDGLSEVPDGGMTEARARDLCEQLFELYQGSFLGEGGEKPWALGLKDKLRVRFLRALVAIGRHYETQGQWERAVDAYERGLIVDPLAEGLYRQLMVCFENQNRKAEAMEIFSRCKRALKAGLELEPSPETCQLFDRLAG
jgi:tetratricopeptide (TPR) repeat protein